MMVSICLAASNNRSLDDPVAFGSSQGQAETALAEAAALLEARGFGSDANE